MAKESPHTARASELYDTGGPRIDENLKPVPTRIRPGKFSDGQKRAGFSDPHIHHHDESVDYLHPKGHAYRADMRERPSAHHPTPPPSPGKLDKR